jgi:hypothetical protein
MSNDEFNRAVANAVLIDKANRVNVNGQREFPDWKERAQILDAVGVQLRMIPEVEAASSAPHRVLHHLAGNPEEAARVAGLEPRQRFVQWVKIDQQLSRPKAPTVPQPPRPAS